MNHHSLWSWKINIASCTSAFFPMMIIYFRINGKMLMSLRLRSHISMQPANFAINFKEEIWYALDLQVPIEILIFPLRCYRVVDWRFLFSVMIALQRKGLDHPECLLKFFLRQRLLYYTAWYMKLHALWNIGVWNIRVSTQKRKIIKGHESLLWKF